MGRSKRAHLPGAPHHIVARTPQDRFPEIIRPLVARHLIEAALSRDCRILALAIMPNHFHILLFQGRYPLGEVMQPAMRRIALHLQRYYGFKGHAFERGFRSRVCYDLAHLRNALFYIHRNPLKAGLCDDSADYCYCSHGAYVTGAVPDHIAVIEGLRIAANSDSEDVDELRKIYRGAFKAYCGVDDEDSFSWTYAPSQRPSIHPTLATPVNAVSPVMRDLADVAARVITEIAPTIPSALIRSGFRGRAVCLVRNQLIATLTQRGYRNKAISTYLNISPQVVSRIRSEMRYGDLIVKSVTEENGN